MCHCTNSTVAVSVLECKLCPSFIVSVLVLDYELSNPLGPYLTGDKGNQATVIQPAMQPVAGVPAGGVAMVNNGGQPPQKQMMPQLPAATSHFN